MAALVAIDVGSIFIAMLFLQALLPLGVAPTPDMLYVLPFVPMALLVFALYGLYGTRRRRHDWAHILKAGSYVVIVAIVVRVLTNLHPHTGLLLVWALGLLLLLAGRYAYDYLLKLIYGGQVDVKRVLLLGGPEACDEVVGSLRPPRDQPSARLIGVVGEQTHPREWQDAAGLRSLGHYEDLERIVDTQHVDQLIVADYEIERRHLPELIELCRRRGLNLKLANLEMRFGAGSVCLVPGIQEPVFVVRDSFTGALPWLAKRIADRLAAALLLVLLSPVFLVVGVIIKATSPGRVFYVDTRVGLGQKTFRCLKFRTMYENAAELQAGLEARNEADGAIFKIKDDPRVTPIGRFLRKTSLDELPQLINVLRGEMSLVGPRPLPLRDNELLEGWHKRRHVVLPGLTGLWQVKGRSDTSFQKMIDLDFDYIESWSPWLDLSILFRTLTAVFGSQGAY